MVYVEVPNPFKMFSLNEKDRVKHAMLAILVFKTNLKACRLTLLHGPTRHQKI